MSKENKEEKILESAILLFSKKGFSATTTSEIAKDAGVAEGTVFRYYKTKKHILIKVMSRLIEVMSEELVANPVGKILKENRDKDDSDILKMLLMDRLEVFNKYWDIIQVIITEIQFHADIRKSFFENVVLKVKDFLGEFIKSGIAKGRFKDFDPTVVSRALLGTFMAYIIQKKIMGDNKEIGNKQEVDEIIELFLNGLTVNKIG
ncbi:TetR/AcrR family transcriptional regulator [Clostridium bowmanii]|uniref:TetR/AcrR family transcriptional regulator n=1 Tax=Clostridium bowmanii TaxID=132925 RepID=UPI001C0AA245|nr:TetR/AcrR family transcriptional regulator [Clostridium bowmanii]MBU3191453.1 TetR/AcrR family transcriptional regulator [Clostridium bowmanii]MCA1075631.1 TetR/AcrR family transcriptional regulator [Clostridium bowmanii]